MNPSPSSPYCVVQTALASASDAAALARRIVQARLGACVQVQAIQSFYVWQDQAHEEAEWRLDIKTRVALYPALEAFIAEHHPYETPEIVQLPIVTGSADYLAWLDAGTRDLDL